MYIHCINRVNIIFIPMLYVYYIVLDLENKGATGRNFFKKDIIVPCT